MSIAFEQAVCPVQLQAEQVGPSLGWSSVVFALCLLKEKKLKVICLPESSDLFDLETTIVWINLTLIQCGDTNNETKHNKDSD